MCNSLKDEISLTLFASRWKRWTLISPRRRIFCSDVHHVWKISFEICATLRADQISPSLCMWQRCRSAKRVSIQWHSRFDWSEIHDFFILQPTRRILVRLTSTSRKNTSTRRLTRATKCTFPKWVWPQWMSCAANTIRSRVRRGGGTTIWATIALPRSKSSMSFIRPPTLGLMDSSQRTCRPYPVGSPSIMYVVVGWRYFKPLNRK